MYRGRLRHSAPPSCTCHRQPNHEGCPRYPRSPLLPQQVRCRQLASRLQSVRCLQSVRRPQRANHPLRTRLCPLDRSSPPRSRRRPPLPVRLPVRPRSNRPRSPHNRPQAKSARVTQQRTENGAARQQTEVASRLMHAGPASITRAGSDRICRALHDEPSAPARCFARVGGVDGRRPVPIAATPSRSSTHERRLERSNTIQAPQSGQGRHPVRSRNDLCSRGGKPVALAPRVVARAPEAAPTGAAVLEDKIRNETQREATRTVSPPSME